MLYFIDKMLYFVEKSHILRVSILFSYKYLYNIFNFLFVMSFDSTNQIDQTVNQIFFWFTIQSDF